MKTENYKRMEQVINHPQILPVGEAESASALTDDALVKAVLTGDDAAFDLIFERYRRLVTHLISRFFYQREEIEELAQQSFTKIYFSLNIFRGERGASLSAWISKITINVCYDELRRRKRRPVNRFADLSDEEKEILERLAQSAAESAESSLIKRDLAEKLLSKLEAPDRVALMLFYVEECSVEEIAGLVGWSQSNVKTRLFRARNFLRDVFKNSK
ncbi:MAG TPA: sigma-70 family RNA polymerase sigma factor [Pyrinomonadaceae bacterium]|nr:sigma-70 family RNA polymerase sigma factor [Pyrinomonadaceae bacterium]